MKRINKLILFCVLIIGSLINVKSAKAYTFNISTIPCTNNQGAMRQDADIMDKRHISICGMLR